MTRGLGRLKKAAKRKNPATHKHRKQVTTIVDSIISEADILLEVLDARFIEKSRNHIAESRIRKKGKPLIYVLNKSDLVDTGKVQLEKELEGLRPYVFFSSKDRRGALALRKLIKINASRIDKDKILVGVIGYPNAGKSSLINYMTGKASARVSSEAGHTKGIQKLKLSEGIYLLDTPGVIPAKEKLAFSHSDAETSASKLPKIGAISWNKTKDPEMTLMHLMKENAESIEKHYGVDAEGDTEILIEQLGRRWHYMKKGNLVDEERTARKVLRDWQEGKIRLF